MRSGRGIEAEYTSSACGRTDCAERGGAVPATLIVPRIHQPAESRLDLEADDVRVEYRAAGYAGQLAGGEDGRYKRRTRMRERHETHVVVVERVRGGAVGEGGVGGGKSV